MRVQQLFRPKKEYWATPCPSADQCRRRRTEYYRLPVTKKILMWRENFKKEKVNHLNGTKRRNTERRMKKQGRPVQIVREQM